MRVICVGNGLAGVIFAKTLREMDSDIEIDVYAEEKYHYYPRPNLIEFVAGNIPEEKVFAFPEEWYKAKKINVHLGLPVRKILPDSKEIVKGQGKREKFDAALIASGSSSFIPPFKGVDKKGIFALRTLEDALAILGYLKDHPKAKVIGGGVLGLEVARALKNQGAEVSVVEFFQHLLPRQLDSQGSALLKAQIESMGIQVLLGLATEEILGNTELTGLKFKDGNEIPADMAVVAAGVRPNIALAKEAGLETDRGITVDDFLLTSHSNIWAAGDVSQHQGKVYGIIPSTFEQAKTAAQNVMGLGKTYKGTVPSNTLKVMGIHLTSIGVVNPEQGAAEEYRKEIPEKGVYKKIVVQKGVVTGAIWMGTQKGVNEISRIITQKADVSQWKTSLLEDGFDFSVL